VSLFSQEKFLSVKPITNQVYLAQFVDNIWVNCIIIKDDNDCILVDSGLNSLADSLKVELKKIGCEKVSYIINTHAHWDHFSGNLTLGKGVKIIAHKNTVNDFKMYGLPEYILPSILVENKKKMSLGNIIVELNHMPNSHSKGDIIVYFPELNILVTGDIFFPLCFPLVSLSEGFSAKQYQKNLQWIESYFPDDVTIVPGHGEIMNKNDLSGYIMMVNETIKEIRNDVENGLTYEQIIEGEPLKKWRLYKRNYSPYNNHKQMWIKAIYETYEKK